MLGYEGKYAVPGQILSMVKHRDKALTNALIAKAVEICDEKQISYLIYFYWGDGAFAEFKRRNGFQKIAVPRYYVPLTLKGQILLKLHLHRGALGVIPEKMKTSLKGLRNKLYEKKYTK